jgi:hypothetical protein
MADLKVGTATVGRIATIGSIATLAVHTGL